METGKHITIIKGSDGDGVLELYIYSNKNEFEISWAGSDYKTLDRLQLKELVDTLNEALNVK